MASWAFIRRALFALIATVLVTAISNIIFLKILFGPQPFPYPVEVSNVLVEPCYVNCVKERQAQTENAFTQSGVSLSPAHDACVTMCQQKKKAFIDALTARMKEDKIIILAYVDLPFVDMAANFYETSLKKHGITQYLFAVSGADCCTKLISFGIPPDACYVFKTDQASGQASSFGSVEFIRKMNIRTDMILEALRAGISVLHSDIDIVFTADPLPVLKSSCSSCDIAPLWDDSVYNAGFVFVRSTPFSIAVYKKMQEMSEAGTKLDDQQQLNLLIRNYTRMVVKPRIKALKLNLKQFLCGKSYFENAKRPFAGDNPCKDCIVIHNNWIVSEEAKIYRFREHHMWQIDHDEYYSSMTRKYITFDLPLMRHNSSLTRQLDRIVLANALAIGQVLNRIVILPKFHCALGKVVKLCPLNDIIMLTNFDASFKNKYREHMFLQHPKVPDVVKKSLSMFYRIESSSFLWNDVIASASEGSYDNPKIFRPANIQEGATSDEIFSWFGSVSDQVLRFHSLYGAFSKFSSPEENQLFYERVKSGIVPGNYRQYTTSKLKNFAVW